MRLRLPAGMRKSSIALQRRPCQLRQRLRCYSKASDSSGAWLDPNGRIQADYDAVIVLAGAATSHFWHPPCSAMAHSMCGQEPQVLLSLQED